MAYDPGAIDATLAAAVGDDPGLIADLRLAFMDSAARSLTAMEGASDPEAWRTAAARLRGLAASFGAVRLMALAVEAGAGSGPDVALLNRIKRAIARL
jgi:HPt (histidine-containing phosphotransfer) domain-containing protein